MSGTTSRWARAGLLGGALTVAVAGTLRSDGSENVSPGTDVEVSLCDGSSSMTLAGVKEGRELSAPEARKAADAMMQAWRRTAGEARWSAWRVESTAAAPAPRVAAQMAAPAPAEAQPTKFTPRDQLLWKREQEKLIADGYANFHKAQALGGTIGISCDMCHPNASNTHPETYPKYQMQLKKVVLLREMINWCIENPMKGKPLPEDDPRLKSVEAYILSERKGVAIEPGKH
jgi:thiosulfate dehydrogenase